MGDNAKLARRQGSKIRHNKEQSDEKRGLPFSHLGHNKVLKSNKCFLRSMSAKVDKTCVNDAKPPEDLAIGSKGENLKHDSELVALIDLRQMILPKLSPRATSGFWYI